MTGKLSRAMQAQGFELSKEDVAAIKRAVPLLIEAGYMNSYPLPNHIKSAEQFQCAQKRLGLANKELAWLLGCSESLIEKMGAGNSPIRPLAGFVLAAIPERVALARIAQLRKRHEQKVAKRNRKPVKPS